MAKSVETVVIITDNAKFALAKYAITFDAVPPGQHATNIKPTAKEASRFNNFAIPQPTKGITVYCAKAPKPIAPGTLSICLKSLTFKVNRL